MSQYQKVTDPKLVLMNIFLGPLNLSLDAPSALVTDNFADKSITMSWKDNSTNESGHFILKEQLLQI